MPSARQGVAAALALAIAVSAGADRASDTRIRLARAALTQVGVTTRYDASYVRLPYPGGDVPRDRGVCTDVVIRAFRAIGIDLQVEVHRDMKQNFRAYPQKWGLRSPDANIDHRRVPNLMRFFERRGRAVPIRGSYEPGDIVAWRLTNGLLHIGLVSTEKRSGVPLVVHNIGAGAQHEDILHAWEIIGHYRW